MLNYARTFIAAGVLIGLAISGTANAQTTAAPPANKTAPPAPAPDLAKPSVAAQVEKWTTKQWDDAKREWAKDKKKWADCRKQSKDQKLEGRKSWSFLYSCMKS